MNEPWADHPWSQVSSDNHRCIRSAKCHATFQVSSINTPKHSNIDEVSTRHTHTFVTASKSAKMQLKTLLLVAVTALSGMYSVRNALLSILTRRRRRSVLLYGYLVYCRDFLGPPL
jgi:hypothetical protein